MPSSFALVALSALLAASSPSVKWEADYGKALKQTRTEEARPLLVVLDKPSADAGRLDPKLLDGAAASANRLSLLMKYELCHIDVTTEYGQEVAKAFGADAFPFVAVIDKSGKVVLHRQSGTMAGESWDAMLASHQAGERAVAHTVAKPVVSEQTATPASFNATPNYGTPVYQTPGYCPSCQNRGY
ncbi:hypothetical protein Pla175_49350 [Pirellulimonas nuda]|uniref:Thioredoxin domain-containing protein n=1 Tax=Pirellulimonas nuda TaxID=2528009 RepID=A0A518DJ83_9BACT|nr:hypothetical protein [Pirellulimonas nuda]QDU91506.1 hypothetical protein Pla175_49350 [Pirellulimonas nuda]